MKGPIVAAALILLTSATAARAGDDAAPPIRPQIDPTRPDWENPAVFAIGKLPAHATGFPYERADLALRGEPASSARFLDLDGPWKFAFSASADDAPKDFFRNGFDVSGWKSITVPADWQTQGYDVPRYNNVTYPFPANRPLIPHDANPVGSYRRDFVLPRSWRDSDTILHIGAAGSAYYVWVNGRKVGYSEDSKLPSEFDISPYVRAGANSVSIQVFRWSDGSYLEDQDFWRVSGIERSVYLISLPRARITDVFARAGLSGDYRDGTLDLTLETRAAARGSSVRASLLDGGKAVLTRSAPISAATLELKATLPGVRTWTAETPDLYTLLIELVDARGRVVQAEARKIGFRTVAIRDGVVTVNGRPITIRGVNRHEHDPQTFHVISNASMRRDIELMKANNINAVRTSHYPNAEAFYDLADEYGLYVMDEANIESHGYLSASKRHPGEAERYLLGYDPAWEAAHVSRVTNMVARDRNHASIIFWSLGNETGVGPSFEKAAAAARAMDPTRLISFLGWTQTDDHRPNAYADIYAPMYHSAEMMRDYAAHREFRQPMIQCEYAHMQGNSGGGLKEDWAVIYAHPDRLQGGFIWDWVEQSTYRYTSDGRRYWGDGGQYGPNPGGDIEFGDGLLQSDRTPNPQLLEVRKVYAPVQFAAVDALLGRFTVTNRHDFRSLSDFPIDWQVTEDGVAIAHGVAPALDTPARGSQAFTLNLPAIARKPGAEYLVTLRARDTRAGAGDPDPGWEQFALGPVEPASRRIPAGRATVSQDAHVMTLAANGARLSVDRVTGLIAGFEKDGAMLLSGGAPNFYRMPTDNDLGTGTAELAAPWKAMSQARKINTLRLERGPSQTTIVVRYDLGSGSAAFETRYTLAGDGALSIDGHFKPLKGNLPEPMRIGLAFDLPTRLDTVRWYGRGPHESYADRKEGTTIGLWGGPLATQYHDFIRPQDTGTKTDVRWMALSGGDAPGVRVAGDAPLTMNALAFPYEDLDRRPPGVAKSSDIVPHDHGTLLIDAVQMGLGGDTSWDARGRPLSAYRVKPEERRFHFVIRPTARMNQALGRIGRQGNLRGVMRDGHLDAVAAG